MAACTSIGGPLIKRRFSMLPLLLIVACSTTAPEMRAALAIAGYCGLAPEVLLPAATPPEIRIGPAGLAAVTFGTLAAEAPTIPPITPPSAPPGTPPDTPPTTPAAAACGGASSSLIILILSGILVGVRSAPWSRSD